jgi:hypothetical protein
MSTLYKHRIFCNTDNRWAYKWTETPAILTTCPDDTTHAVQPGSASIDEEKSDNAVVINKEPGVVTHGNVRVDTVVLSAGAGASVTVTKAWLYDIAIYTLRAGVTADCVGCDLTLEAAPRTTVGVLTADAPTGTTVLNVSPTAAANITPGNVVTLQQGVTIQELGVATAVDTAANTITVELPTTSGFAAAGPTLVKVTKRAADRMELPLVGYLTFGEDRAKAVALQKGRPLAFTLVNPNAAAARLVVYVSYNY